MNKSLLLALCVLLFGFNSATPSSAHCGSCEADHAGQSATQKDTLEKRVSDLEKSVKDVGCADTDAGSPYSSKSKAASKSKSACPKSKASCPKEKCS